MKRWIQMRKPLGFTMLEMMIGAIIFIIGVLGFSGMVAMQAKGTRVARGLDDAATLVQSAVEGMSAVTYSNLGNDSGLPTTNGLNQAQVWTTGPMNKKGEVIGTGVGPYSYYRSIVVCTSATAATAPGATPTYCGGSMGGTARPAELACSNISPALTTREKMIRVLVSWTDQGGKCHYKTTNSLVFQ